MKRSERNRERERIERLREASLYGQVCECPVEKILDIFNNMRAEPNPETPYVDEDEERNWIHEHTGIALDIIDTIIQADMDFLVYKGIASERAHVPDIEE